MNFYHFNEDLSQYSFNEAFEIARASIGGANGLFTWNGETYNTLLSTEKTDLINQGLWNDYKDSIKDALSQFNLGEVTDVTTEGLSQIPLPDPPMITDTNSDFANEELITDIPFVNTDTEFTTGEIASALSAPDDGGSIWDAIQELGSAVAELFAGDD